MNNDSTTSKDCLGYADDLRRALALPAVAGFQSSAPGPATEEAARAAYMVAVALGHCRRFGIELPSEIDGTLPANMAHAAAQLLTRKLSDWKRLAEQSSDAAEGEDNVRESIEEWAVRCLEARMQSWACHVVIEESYLAALEDQAENLAALTSAVDVYLDALEAFDQALLDRRDLLAEATNSRLLDNSRALLAEPLRRELPWWLDGSLEQIAGDHHALRSAKPPRRGERSLAG